MNSLRRYLVGLLILGTIVLLTILCLSWGHEESSLQGVLTTVPQPRARLPQLRAFRSMCLRCVPLGSAPSSPPSPASFFKAAEASPKLGALYCVLVRFGKCFGHFIAFWKCPYCVALRCRTPRSSCSRTANTKS